MIIPTTEREYGLIRLAGRAEAGDDPEAPSPGASQKSWGLAWSPFVCWGCNQ
jgi:hypothetical protein